MRKIACLMTSLSLGMALAAAAPAAAQEAAQAAAGPNLAPGTVVYDSEGAEIGPVSSEVGDNIVVMLGDKPVTLPKNAFGQSDKGPAITITRAQLTAAVDQAAAQTAAALDAAIQPGADILGANGSAVVGKVKLVEADGIVVETSSGDVKLPRHAFFLSPKGLATSFTAEQFAAAVAEATAPAAASEAVVDADTETPDRSAN